MKKLWRMIAVITALLMLAAALSCSGGEEAPEPEDTALPTAAHEAEATAQPTDIPAPAPVEGEVTLSAEQEARVRELAAAFALFGDCDMSRGLDLMEIERIIYCFYTGKLEGSDVQGFGRVSAAEADAVVSSIFKGVKLMDLLRTQRDPEKEQDYYYEDGAYYIRLAETAPEVEIVSVQPLAEADGTVIGIRVMARVNGSSELKLDLVSEDDGGYSLLRSVLMLEG